MFVSDSVFSKQAQPFFLLTVTPHVYKHNTAGGLKDGEMLYLDVLMLDLCPLLLQENKSNNVFVAMYLCVPCGPSIRLASWNALM